ncbi:MAG TPA: alginate export family protein [Vicinamibacterales bacterium]|nr:alginate export family protein [Vicinamibacterales bacterium]
MSRAARVVFASALMLLSARAAVAQTTSPPAASTTWTLRDWTRVEMWRFFEPPAGGGSNDYTFAANRLFGSVQRTSPAYDLTAALQYVQFGGLPDNASGPGPLGTGAVYYAHAGRTDSRQVYLRFANVRFKRLVPRTTIQVGRMPYSSGGEAASGNPKIEAVKLQRVAARLIGEFDWSIYQRAYDGVRGDTVHRRWTATGFAFHPTQGGFEDAAGLMMPAVTVLGGAATIDSAAATPSVQYQLFSYRYRDTRRVTQRPDNTGRPASAADVGINTYGGAVMAAPAPRGGHQWDALMWIALQSGSWYEQAHRAASVAAEAGHQWTAARWQPWLRAGYLYASGDGDPSDNRHGTFFEMLPTVRRYAQSALYSQMNDTDLFAQLFAKPRPNVSVRVDWHRVGLASSGDGWYFGSGATQQQGNIFGFATRPSFGSTRLATLGEGSLDYAMSPHWSVNGYLAVGRGGGVVAPAFAGRTLTFAYVENVLQF